VKDVVIRRLVESARVTERTAETQAERLVAAGVRMHSFAEKDPSLEDVFMLVTKGLVI